MARKKTLEIAAESFKGNFIKTFLNSIINYFWKD
jgi:hypothetical protein